MLIDLPEDLGAALVAQASVRGLSPAGYVCEILQRDLAPMLAAEVTGMPYKTGRGSFARYGQAPSADEIDANRAEMFRNFGKESA